MSDEKPKSEFGRGGGEGPTKSAFGRGVVICLVKFSEHLQNRIFDRAVDCEYWRKASAETRQKHTDEAEKYPNGDAARLVSNATIWPKIGGDYDDNGVDSALRLWASGASDHFYDLDRELAPPCLRELADLMLRMGHGFTGEKYTWAHVEKIYALWQQSCELIDKKLGVVDGDWGQW